MPDVRPDPRPARTPGGIGQQKRRRDPKPIKMARTQISTRVYCEVGVEKCERIGTQFHHILPRSRGGEDTPDNGLWVCAHCHWFIHANPAVARRAGWLR